MNTIKPERLAIIKNTIGYLQRMIDAATDITENNISETKACKNHNIDRYTFRYFIMKAHNDYENPNDDINFKNNLDDFGLICNFLTWQERLATYVLENTTVPGNEKKQIAITDLPVDIVETIDYVLDMITEREAKVLRMRFDENMTYADIAEEFNVTYTRVREIESKALHKLKHPSRINLIRFGLAKHKEINDAIAEARKLKYIKPDALPAESDNIDTDTDQKYMLHINSAIRYYHKYGDIKLDELPLSVRTYNVLKRNGYNTLNDLKKLSDKDLMQTRNIGTHSYNEIALYMNEILDMKIPYVPYRRTPTADITYVSSNPENTPNELKKELTDRLKYSQYDETLIESNVSDYSDKD